MVEREDGYVCDLSSSQDLSILEVEEETAWSKQHGFNFSPRQLYGSGCFRD
jgi:hypothetical protein